MSKKPIIVFEGVEGSGKSHHISVVSTYLKKKNIDHIKIREHGGNLNSEKIRKLILSKKSGFNKNTDLLLYLAARSENIKVDFTFLNLVNRKNLYSRLKKRKSLNRYDNFNMSFYDKVQKGFIRLSKNNKKKYFIVNSNLNIKNNEKLILKIMDKLIK